MSKRIAIALCLIAGCKADATTKSEPAPTPSPTEVAPATGDRPTLPAQQGERRGRPSKFDADHDGKVSPEERKAGRQKRTEALLGRLDANKDGKVTVEELKAAPNRRIKFDNPEAIDADKDGTITAAEFEVAMKARRDARKGSGGGSDDHDDGGSGSANAN